MHGYRTAPAPQAFFPASSWRLSPERGPGARAPEPCSPGGRSFGKSRYWVSARSVRIRTYCGARSRTCDPVLRAGGCATYRLGRREAALFDEKKIEKEKPFVEKGFGERFDSVDSDITEAQGIASRFDFQSQQLFHPGARRNSRSNADLDCEQMKPSSSSISMSVPINPIFLKCTG